MKSRDDLLSVLHLGWEATRQAWRLLTPETCDSFAAEDFGPIGRSLDQLAYDLRHLGQGKPARLAFSVAFVLNGIAARTIQFDTELANKTGQIVAILAEMLLELEATSQITAEEPTEIVECLKVNWGLVMYAEEHSSKLPHPHFRHYVEKMIPEETQILASISEELYWATDSLLNRVMRDGDFPYTTALSRIHHLGTTLREQLVPQSQRSSDVALTAHEDRPEIAPAKIIEAVPAAINESIAIISIEPSERRNVLIIDQSSFIRMLLTSAIESMGLTVRPVACLSEARALSAEIWDLIVCDSQELDSLPSAKEWLLERITNAQATLITLINEPAATTDDSVNSNVHQIRRADISALLNLIKSVLNTRVSPVRLSA